MKEIFLMKILSKNKINSFQRIFLPLHFQNNKNGNNRNSAY